MRSTIIHCVALAVVVMVAPASGRAQATGQAGQSSSQDTTRHKDTVSHRHRTTRHDTTSNGAVTGKVGNQDQSGVVNSKGTSTMGSGIKKVTPTQGHAVTAKGDTLRGADSTRASGRRRMIDSARDSTRTPKP